MTHPIGVDGLVTSAPVGPMEPTGEFPVPGCGGWARSRSHRISATVRGTRLLEPFLRLLFEGGGCHRCQEGVREHRQGDVAVPADVAADFVLVQAALVHRGLEALLDGPPCVSHPNQFGHPPTPEARPSASSPHSGPAPGSDIAPRAPRQRYATAAKRLTKDRARKLTTALVGHARHHGEGREREGLASTGRLPLFGPCQSC